ncbi:hypothetical protein JCM3774_005922 [Rhodotorula dairenensis]
MSSSSSSSSPVTTATQNRPDDLDDRCLPQYSALDNSYGHNPCRVARFLIDECDFYEYYPLRPLDLRKGRQNYPVPDLDQATACLCSMSVYNLVQACAACQQTEPYTSTLWADWVSNCTYGMVNNGHIFPTSCPPQTEIPAWATVDSASGSLSVGSVYQRASTGNSTLLVSAVPAATSSPSGTQTAQTYTEVTIPLQTNGSYPSGGDSDRRKDAIAGAAVAVAFVGILFVSTFIYFRRRKRRINTLQGLDTTADLAAWDLGGDLSLGSTSRVDHKPSSMLERSDGSSVLSVGGDGPLHVHGSRRSIATNSVSTGLPVMVYRGHAGPRSTRSTRRTSLTSGSDDYGLSAADEDSISPFSDLNRPAPSVPATRDNIHRTPSFNRSYSSFSLTPSSFTRSLVADDDRGSLHSRRSRVTSSGGATRANDGEDDVATTSSSRII